MEFFSILIVAAVVLIICFACKWVAELCDYRQGAESYRAVFFTLFFTPVAGLLYVIAHKPIEQEEQEEVD